MVGQQLVRDQGAVGAPGDDIGERAAPVDPEFPAFVGWVLGLQGAFRVLGLALALAGDGQVAVGRLDVRGGQRGQVGRGGLVIQAHDPDVPAGAGPLE